ncbi:MAG TPA: SpoIVB peptidase S55 domain-containing protein [Terriglobia bacterium]|nr:SpoIVB peptidase S55 domain-containing protein [Terriglobia bacterium]
MKTRWLATSLLVSSFVIASAFLAPVLRAQDDIKFFPLSEVRPGQKGVGRTIFQGDNITEFQVEILGVLRNAVAPKQDLILARLAGGPLAETGVIAGMSGSPVYIDGKLVGAVALAFPFSKEPIAGITPIEQMIDVVPQARTAADGHLETARAASGAVGSLEAGQRFKIVNSPGGPRFIPDPGETGAVPVWMRRFTSQSSPSSMVNLSLPLHFGGFPGSLVETYAPVFRAMGFEPMAGGVLSGAPTPVAGDSDATKSLIPGSMVSLFLVSGDLNLNADCTVTYRKGDDLYACGHRLLQVGPAEIPFAPAHVLVTVPSLSSSFKIDVPGQPVGTIQQDRFSAVYGVLGDKASLIPVHIRLDSTLNRQTDYNLNIIQEPFLSPLLLNLAVVSVLTATERAMGPSTLDIKGKIRLSGGQSVDLEDVASSEMGAAGPAGLAVATPLNYIMNSNFPGLHVEGIDIAAVSQDERRVADVEQVWATQSEVHPGDHIEVTALLRTPSGESLTEKIPVTIPDSISDKVLSLIVGGGAGLNAMQFRITPLTGSPRSLDQLVRALNRMRRNNRLYALLMAPQRSFILQGDEYPSPPPSLLQTLMAEPGASSSATFSWTSVIGDFEAGPSPYTIHGDKMLLLRVASEGD